MRLIDADAVHATILQAFSDGHDDPTRKLLGDLIDEAPTITPLPNDPLTLEELRELEGEPVWVERLDGGISRWAVFGDMYSLHGAYFGTAVGGLRLPYDGCGKTWLAYRRKPEEGTTNYERELRT